MKYRLILFFIIAAYLSEGQSSWEINGGIGYSNVLIFWNNEQIVFVDPPNSPNYILTYNFSVNKIIFRAKKFEIKLGFGFIQRGSADYEHIYAPVDTIVPHKLLYLGFPFCIDYRLLENKEIYFCTGITPALLIRNKLDDISGNGLHDHAFYFAKKYQLNYEFGFRFPLYKQINGKFNFTRGIYSLSEIPDPYEKRREINISFDFCLIYKF